MKLYVSLLILLISTHSKAENYLTYLGGGGEPKASSGTMFDNGLKAVSELVKTNASHWNYEIRFNGGHKETEALIQDNFTDAKTKQSFTKDSLKISVADYLKDINSGKIKSGDQLLVMINSHGGAKTETSQSHLIAVGSTGGTLNLKDLSGAAGVVNLDQLQDLIKAANEKGIKLGIVDFSCHSGNTLNLANDKTCIISSAGPDHFSYSIFSKAFIGNMKSGKSLEQIFLETRLSPPDYSYPMISTPAGQEINNKLYPRLAPYLNYDSNEPKSHTRMLSDYIQQAASKPDLCNNDENFAQLKKQMQDLRQTLNTQNNPEITKEIDLLETLVSNYKTKIDAKIKTAKEVGAAEFNSENKITIIGNGKYRNKTEQLSNNFTAKDLIESDFDKIIKSIDDTLLSDISKSIYDKEYSNDEQRARYQASLDLFQQAKQRQQQLITSRPDLKNYRDKFKASMNDMYATSYGDVTKIIDQERKVYDLWYKQKSSQENKPNACSEFKL